MGPLSSKATFSRENFIDVRQHLKEPCGRGGEGRSRSEIDPQSLLVKPLSLERLWKVYLSR